MTVLTTAEITKQYGPTKSELDKYFKAHPKLKRTPQIVRRIKDQLTAAKIARTPGKEVSFSQSAAEWQIIYGSTRVGGVLTAVAGGANNTAIHLVYTIAGHQVSSVDKLFLDDEEVVFGGAGTFDSRWSSDILRKDGTKVSDVSPNQALNQIFMSPTLGTIGQATNSDFHGQLPNYWTNFHTQDGCAYVYIILGWAPTLFPNGVPDITFQVTGKPVYNPATATTTSSSNAADIIADYLMDTRYGMGVAMADIDSTQWLAAHNKCAETVTIQQPVAPNYATTEARYTIDGVFKVSETPDQILSSMAAAMGGSVVFVGGKWKICPATYRAPTITLTEDDILGDIRVQTKLSRKDSFNGVKGTFTSPGENYEETDFPAVKNDGYMQLDNNERVWQDIQLLLTNSPSKCQRLAKIALEQNRQAISVQMTCTLKAYQLEPKDTVILIIDRMGWDVALSKVFEVQQLTLVMADSKSGGAPALAVQLMLRETSSKVYDFNNGDENRYDIAPNTNLPNPLAVATITGVTLASGTAQLYVRSDGTVFSRIKVSWATIPDFFVTSGGNIEINYKKSSDVAWIGMSLIPGENTSAYILDVQDHDPRVPGSGIYDVRVRARNALNVYGAWTTVSNYTVIGKTAAPSQVTGFGGSYESTGVRLYWDTSSDADVRLYEIRYGSANGTWEEAQFLDRVEGTVYASTISTARDYVFMIKAIDTSGNYSNAEARLSLAIEVPEAPAVSIRVEGTVFIVSWTAPASHFTIDQYEIRYGVVTDDNPTPTFETSSSYVETKATSFRAAITWSGTRIFWVIAKDVNGNVGAAGAVTITITSPGQVVVTEANVIDNFVLIKWAQSVQGTLPIAKYKVLKGAVYATATLIGEVGGTFTSHFEDSAGSYTYWIIAFDSAGNQSTPTSVVLQVSAPPDFVLTDNGVLNPKEGRTGTNVYIEGYGFLVPGTSGGPGGDGSPVGILAGITQSTGPGVPVTPAIGNPVGLLVGITYSDGSVSSPGGGPGGDGSPVGLLAGITSTPKLTMNSWYMPTQQPLRNNRRRQALYTPAYTKRSN